MTTKELVFSYVTDGARAAERADSRVRDSVRKTGRTAQRESNTVERWMTRNRTAINSVAAATAGAMGAILSASPTLRAEMSGVRTSFTLLADTIVRDVLPGTGSLTEATLELAQAYRDLPDDTRESLSTLIIMAGVAGAVTLALGPVAGLIAGIGVAAALHKGDLSDLLDTLDDLASAAFDLTLDAITFAVEDDVIQTAADDIITFIFPSIEDADGILDWIFDVNLSGLMIVSAVFGGLAIGAAKILPAVFGSTISAGAIIAFVFPILATSAIISHVFDINMTATAILGAIFAGVIITAAAILGAISFPVIAGAAILGTIFAGVAIKGWEILQEIDWPTISASDLIGQLRNPSTDPRTDQGTTARAFGAGYATGGRVTSGGFAKLHKGNMISPAADIDRSSPMESGGSVRVDNIEVVIQGSGNNRRDGREIGQQIAQEFNRELGGRGV